MFVRLGGRARVRAGTWPTPGAFFGQARDISGGAQASDRVIGTDVRRPDGKWVGPIERLMRDKVSGRVAYAVMSFGGFLGLGEDSHTLPWSVLRFEPRQNAYVLDLTDEQLRAAPARPPRAPIRPRTAPGRSRSTAAATRRPTGDPAVVAMDIVHPRLIKEPSPSVGRLPTPRPFMPKPPAQDRGRQPERIESDPCSP